MRNKRGVSLIVLVITIVVVIILAAAVILSLSGNNPINNARIANLDQTKDGIEASLLTYIGKAHSQTLGYYAVEELITGNRSETEEYSIIGDKKTINNNYEEIYNIDKTKFESKIDTLPSAPTSSGEWYVDGNGKVYLVYDKKGSLPKWMLNKDGDIDDTFLNKFVVLKGSAEEVANNPKEYYGKSVTNYSANGVNEWKIFHSDGTNIYLISSDYLSIDKVPKSRGGNELTVGNYKKTVILQRAVDDESYSLGTQSIDSDNRARKWLALYLNNVESTRNNIKAVAYMLDTKVWNLYKSDKADYAIGGPTIEMLIQSYNNKYDKKYEYRVSGDLVGYEVSADGGKNWNYEREIFKENKDDLYFVPLKNPIEAYAMWVSSPSSRNSVCVINAASTVVAGNNLAEAHIGLRPVVCLKSDVEVKINEEGNVVLN